MFKLTQENVVRLTDRPDMTVAADWDIKPFGRIQHVPYHPFNSYEMT